MLFHEVRSSGFINIYNCENDIPLAWITFPLKRIPIDSFKFIDSLFHTWTGHIGLWQIYETSYIHWQHQWTLRKKMNDVQITDLEFHQLFHNECRSKDLFIYLLLLLSIWIYCEYPLCKYS